MEDLNIQLFALLNAPVHPDPRILLIARGLAVWGVPFAGLWMAVLWVRTGEAFRMVLLDAALAAIVGLGINQLVGLLWYHPRPPAIGLGHQFLPHSPETSFPSDHVTLVFSVSLVLLTNAVSRVWGLALLLLSLAIAWSRIYVGVHFPFDMVGSLIVACVAVLVLRSITPRLRSGPYRWLLRLYEIVVRRLALPEALFPRSGENEPGA